MQSEVRVVADNGQEFTFNLDHLPALSNAEARQWLDDEYNRLGGEPLRPTGKLLLADKVVVVAQAAGPRLLGDAAWGQRFAQAASASLGKPVVRVNVPALSVSY
ncbi:MAG: hypothetical protein Q4D74_09830 [Comamonadaceae bacterium]|nr:hypothetical protein [Propionibacteriaceae bacterium]MDO5087886.1 hypothetical protein [Comamonadaceae bacterium]RRD55945.1 hypothetical protein EII20_12925 [Comamonadaceae bacterium OH2545_COT-014]